MATRIEIMTYKISDLFEFNAKVFFYKRNGYGNVKCKRLGVNIEASTLQSGRKVIKIALTRIIIETLKREDFFNLLRLWKFKIIKNEKGVVEDKYLEILNFEKNKIKRMKNKIEIVLKVDLDKIVSLGYKKILKLMRDNKYKVEGEKR